MIHPKTRASDQDRRIERLEQALEEAMLEITRLRKVVDEQAKIIKDQAKIIKDQGKVIKDQAKIIEEWKRGLRKRGRRTRKKKRKGAKAAAKKPGRKDGHEGAFRPPPDEVDAIEHHEIDCCLDCGSATEATGRTRVRHREEIIPARRRVIEEVDHESRCVVCGRTHWARPAPPPSKSTVLGPSVIALAMHLRFGVKLSWHDAAKFISSTTGVKVTTGGLTQLFARLAVKLRPVLAEIKREALSLPFLHLDETSWYETAALRWLWIVSHPSLSFFHVDPSRGREVARTLLTGEDEELFRGVAVTDFYAAYRYLEGLDHQYCWPHLVRDARKIVEVEGGALPERFLSSLVSIYHDGKQAQDREDESLKHGVRVRLGKLVADEELASHPGIARLQARIHEEFHALLTFLDVPGLPADNNQAERDLRFMVILRGLSFQTRSPRGSQTMADMMSVAQTARKQEVVLEPFLTEALEAAYQGRDPPSLLARA